MLNATGCEQCTLIQNNGSKAPNAVPHVHFNIIPKPNDVQGLSLKWATKELENGENLLKKILLNL